MLRVVTTCTDFARDCDIQRDKSKDPFQPSLVPRPRPHMHKEGKGSGDLVVLSQLFRDRTTCSRNFEIDPCVFLCILDSVLHL